LEINKYLQNEDKDILNFAKNERFVKRCLDDEEDEQELCYKNKNL
jgi:hypothetical protein